MSDGSYASKPAYDDAVQGLSGIAGAFATRDGDPKLIPSVIADKNAAWVAAAGILSAVISRFRTGKGCYLETGMFEAISAWNLVEHLHDETFAPPLSNMGYPRMMTSDRRPHRTKDGYLCLLAYTDRQWRKFWSLTNKPENAKDPRFATMADRSRHIGELYAAAGDELVIRTSSEWLSLLDEADIPAGPVNSFDDLRQDPHLNAIGFFRSYAHPSEGKLISLDTGYRFNGKPLPVHRHQPRLGEHTADILADLGFSDSEIQELMGNLP